MPKGVVKWWQWYHKLTGLDTVEVAKQKINDIQDRIFEYQDKKRNLNKQMMDVTYKLRDISSELMQTKRDDIKNVHLTKLECINLQEQNKIMEQLALLDIEEKDNITRLTTAYKEYQDSQNLNAQKYKYLSIIASALVAVVSLSISIMLNNMRMRDVRNTIHNAQEKINTVLDVHTNQFLSLQNTLNSFKINFPQNNTNVRQITETKSENTSNIVTCAKYMAYSLATGASYVKKGVYACGSYVGKFFY